MNKIQSYIVAPWKRLVREPAFLVCVFVLAVSAFGFRLWGGGDLLKLPLALRKPLEALDPNRLAPYEVVKLPKIGEETIVEALGTKDYIQWQLLDTGLSADDPFYRGNLFVTYYTGNPDKVPHVPDWCYVGSGGIIDQKLEISITVPGCGRESDGDQLTLRILEIKTPHHGIGMTSYARRVVSYVFGVNGDYACTRTEVRMKQRNRKDRYAYFSKVEVWFEGGQELPVSQHVEAMEKIYRKVLPLLWSEHWPDWEAASQGN